jgi:hypothetical protein
MRHARPQLTHSLAAARATTPEERGRALVALAEALRCERRHHEALTVLDVVEEERPSAELRLAAYAGAVAVHCSRGALRTARVVGEDAITLACETGLLRALGRLHVRAYRASGQEALRGEAHRCFGLADAADQLAAPAA